MLAVIVEDPLLSLIEVVEDSFGFVFVSGFWFCLFIIFLLGVSNGIVFFIDAGILGREALASSFFSWVSCWEWWWWWNSCSILSFNGNKGFFELLKL